MTHSMTAEQLEARKTEVEAEAHRMMRVIFDFQMDYVFFDPQKSLESLNEIENVTKDTIRDIHILARKHGLHADHLTLFLYLAKRRKAVEYKKIETWQDQVNELSKLTELFTAPQVGTILNHQVIPNPIKRINLKMRNGSSVELSNETLLFNFYNQMYPALTHFLNGYIKDNYRKIVKRQGASKGLDKSNKKLAHNFFKYLKIVSPELKGAKMARIVLGIFEHAGNSLPYGTEKKCWGQLGPK